MAQIRQWSRYCAIDPQPAFLIELQVFSSNQNRGVNTVNPPPEAWNVPTGQCQVIGEIGQAHDGSLGTAHALIDVIADSGAAAVKFQTHIAAAESTPSEPWRVKFSRQDATRYDYWKRMEFSEAQWHELRQHSEDRGLAFISSPFSTEALELLKRVGVAAWKVASGEVSNHDLLTKMADSGTPIILSSGMSTWHELDESVALCVDRGASVTVLQCTTAYPCSPNDWGLNVITEMQQRYGCAVGLSDHSGEIYAGLAAAATGASVIEVHVTLSKRSFGPDVPASLTPDQLRRLVSGTQEISQARNHPVDKDVIAGRMSEMRSLFRKSLVAATDLPARHRIGVDDIVMKKPGTGIPADQTESVLGRTLHRAVARDHLFSEADFND